MRRPHFSGDRAFFQPFLKEEKKKAGEGRGGKNSNARNAPSQKRILPKARDGAREKPRFSLSFCHSTTFPRFFFVLFERGENPFSRRANQRATNEQPWRWIRGHPQDLVSMEVSEKERERKGKLTSSNKSEQLTLSSFLSSFLASFHFYRNHVWRHGRTRSSERDAFRSSCNHERGLWKGFRKCKEMRSLSNSKRKLTSSSLSLSLSLSLVLSFSLFTGKSLGAKFQGVCTEARKQGAA